MSSDTTRQRRLPEQPDLADVFRAYPVGVRELLVYHDLVLRHPAPLSVADRELIAALVSGINACGYCYGAHSIIAGTFGVDEGIVRAVVENPAVAPVTERLRPILRLVEKLTRSPASVRHADREAVYAAGWSEEALFYAVASCALFNLMNRLVEGMGVATSLAIQARQRARHQRSPGDPINPNAYQDYGRAVGLLKPD